MEFTDFRTTQKIQFSIRDFFSKCDQIPQFPADLVTFPEEISDGKVHFLCCVVFLTWHAKFSYGSPSK